MSLLRSWPAFCAASYKDFAPTELIIRSKSRKRLHTVEDDEHEHEDD